MSKIIRLIAAILLQLACMQSMLMAAMSGDISENGLASTGPLAHRLQKPIEQQKPLSKTARYVILDQTLLSFEAEITYRVECRSQTHRRLLNDYLEAWREKVLSLKEFAEEFGAENDLVDVQFSPLEKKLLQLLRKAQVELPLFTDIRSPKELRKFGEEYGRFMGNYADKKPPQGWKKISPAPYLAMVPELQKWLDDTAKKKITPRMLRLEHLSGRSSDLINDIGFEVSSKHNLGRKKNHEIDKVGRITHNTSCNIFEKQKYLDYLLDDKKLPAEKLKQLTAVELALFNYLKSAMKHNPVFKDLDHRVEYEVFQRITAVYVKKGRAAEEQVTYDKAFHALEIAVGAVKPKPKQTVPAPDANTTEPVREVVKNLSSGNQQAEDAVEPVAAKPVANNSGMSGLMKILLTVAGLMLLSVGLFFFLRTWQTA